MPSTMRPVMTPPVAVGAFVEFIVQGENAGTPDRSTQLFVVSEAVAGAGDQPYARESP